MTTFPMSELSPSATKVTIEDEEVKGNYLHLVIYITVESQEAVDESTPLKSLKEIEEEREAEKKREQRFVRFVFTLNAHSVESGNV